VGRSGEVAEVVVAILQATDAGRGGDRRWPCVCRLTLGGALLEHVSNSAVAERRTCDVSIRWCCAEARAGEARDGRAGAATTDTVLNVHRGDVGVRRRSSATTDTMRV
jgi:hypothetical protein